MRVVSETGSRSNILDKLKRYYLLFDIYDVGTEALGLSPSHPLCYATVYAEIQQ